jgi:hypothetical protein
MTRSHKQNASIAKATAKRWASSEEPAEHNDDGRPQLHDPGPSGTTKRRRDDDRLSGQRAKTKAKHAKVKRHEATIGALTAELDECGFERDTLQSRFGKLQGDYTGLMARHQLVLKSLEELQVQNTKLSEELLARTKSVVGLEHTNLQLQHKLENSQHTAADLRVRRDTLLTTNKKLIQQVKRDDAHIRTGDSKKQNVFQLKSGGSLCDAVCLCIMELTRLDVASQNVYRVMLSVATALDVELAGSFARSSVLQIVDEAGLAGIVQLGEAMANASCKYLHTACDIHIMNTNYSSDIKQ